MNLISIPSTQSEFCTNRPLLKKIRGIYMAYDINNAESFYSLHTGFADIKELTSEHLALIVVGTGFTSEEDR